MEWANALRLRIEAQKGFQLSRDEDDLHDHFTEFFCEGLEWVLEQIEQLECAEHKAEEVPEMPDGLSCDTCDD